LLFSFYRETLSRFRAPFTHAYAIGIGSVQDDINPGTFSFKASFIALDSSSWRAR
jgi:hypothetical protein